ncbi:intraflagellar transport protein 25 homolog [Procambarus clarkii]|uniref:intraflagellar transport protein 25 homolog n=1 Tax=Procambarus clarkii TaxID=6728 RepID=UPI001E677F16|nr:intraflagellar transport protein 25 homolog [Procambarus clarkii]
MVDAKVVYASSQDPTFPPSAMLDGRPDTFWASSGLYPQVVVLTLPGLTAIDNLAILAYNVRKVSVARSIKTQPTDFEEVVEKELPHDDGKLQSSVLSAEQMTAVHIRITIVEGHDHFCSVHKVSVAGTVTQGYGGGQAVPAPKKVMPSKPAIVSSPPKQQPTRTPVQVTSKPSPQIEQDDEENDHLPPTTYIQDIVEDIPDDEDY